MLEQVVITQELIDQWYDNTRAVPKEQVLDLFNFDCAVGAIPTNDSKRIVFKYGNLFVGKDKENTITLPISSTWNKDELKSLKEAKRGFTLNSVPSIHSYKTEVRKDFIFHSKTYPDKLEGKEWADFRQGLNHNSRDGVTIEQHYGKISESLYQELEVIIKGWKKTKFFVGYNPTGISKMVRDFDLNTYMTVIRYQGRAIHYFTSEQINRHYIVLLDGKMVNDEAMRKLFPNIAKAAHLYHIRHWQQFADDVYYNMGYSADTGAQFKKSLKPFLEQPHHYHTPVVEKVKRTSKETKGIF